MKIKNILALVCFLLVLFACTNEDIIELGDAGKDVEIGKPVTITLSLNTPNAPVVETKAGGEQFGSITSLHSLIYDVDKSNELKVVPLTLTGGAASEQTNLKLPTTTGTKKIYVIANWDLKEGSLEERFAAEASLKTWSSTAAKISTEEPTSSPMLGFVDADYGASVVAYEAGTVSELVIDVDKMYKKQGNDLVALNGNIQASVIPSYSKISFEVVNNIHTDMDKKVQLEISNVYVRNLPKKYSLYPFPEKTLGTDDVDPGRTKIMEGASSCEFYMYENLQGDSKNNENAAWKSPFADKGPASSGDMNLSYEKWNKYWAGETACTYIEVEGKYSIWKSATVMGTGDIHYRFFLGGDAFKNFDVKRNMHYKVQLVFSGIGGYDELKYEWRVNAQLNDVTFIPSGTLEIDGSADSFFKFFVINSSTKSQTITTSGFTGSDMQVGYYDDNSYLYYPWQFTNQLPQNLANIIGGTFKEYRVKSINLGILGQTAYNTDGNRYQQNGNAKSYTYSSNVDEIKDIVAGNIYRTRIFDLSNDEAKLIVKEYPLLCLTSTGYGPSDSNAEYAQRIDRKREDGGSLVTKDIAMVSEFRDGMLTRPALCTAHGGPTDPYFYPSSAPSSSLYSYVPTPVQLQKMVDLETGPLKPQDGAPYWTTDGIYYWEKPIRRATDIEKAYVRCVYQKRR